MKQSLKAQLLMPMRLEKMTGVKATVTATGLVILTRMYAILLGLRYRKLWLLMSITV